MGVRRRHDDEMVGLAREKVQDVVSRLFGLALEEDPEEDVRGCGATRPADLRHSAVVVGVDPCLTVVCREVRERCSLEFFEGNVPLCPHLLGDKEEAVGFVDRQHRHHLFGNLP
ncbi:hypothetical protein D3C87_1653660 [compost metagenome]